MEIYSNLAMVPLTSDTVSQVPLYINMVVKLSWLANAYSRPVLSAGDLEE